MRRLGTSPKFVNHILYTTPGDCRSEQHPLDRALFPLVFAAVVRPVRKHQPEPVRVAAVPVVARLLLETDVVFQLCQGIDAVVGAEPVAYARVPRFLFLFAAAARKAGEEQPERQHRS